MRRKPLILCVDEHLSSVQYALARLFEAGCDVLAADDLVSAMQILKNESVDLVFLDERMANRELGNAFGKIRANSPNLPIVLTCDGTDLSASAPPRGGTVPFRRDSDANAWLEMVDQLLPAFSRHRRSRAS